MMNVLLDFKYESKELSQIIVSSQTLEENAKKIVDSCLNNLIQTTTDSYGNLKENVFMVFEYLKNVNIYDNRNTIVAQLNSLIDKFPTLLVKISNSDTRVDSDFIYVLSSIFSLMIEKGSNDLLSHIIKSLPKLITTCCKICSTNTIDNIHLGCAFLVLFSKSKVRPYIASQSQQINKLCTDLLSNSFSNNRSSNDVYYYDKFDSLSELKAYYLSVESPEKWSAEWQIVLNEIVIILNELGIKTSYDNKYNGKDNTKRMFSEDNCKIVYDLMKIKNGIEKALHLKKIFYFLCGIVKQMLLCGCSTGPCQIDLYPFITIIDSLMPIYSDVSPSEAVNLIQNESLLTPIDLSLVIPQLKIYFIDVVIAFLEIGHPSLIRYGKSIYRPIATLLSRHDTKQSPLLVSRILVFMSLAFQALPNVVSNSFNSGGTAVLDLLKVEMDILTASKSLISTSTDEKDNNSSGIVCEVNSYRSLLFEATESLLLYCGSLLSSSVRQSIESILGQGLSCITKGVRYPQFPDRKQHLLSCEIIRQDIYIQNLLIKLCTAELLCGPVDGLVSGNVTLLKLVCECCSKHHITCYEAKKGLLIIGTILHPCAVTLPSIPAVDMARSFLERMKSIGNTTESSNANDINNLFGGFNKDDDINSYVTTTTKVDESNYQNKKQRISEESEKVTIVSKMSNKKEVIKQDAKSKSFKKLDKNIIINQQNSNSNNKGSDDELEIPDIDIDAEPDSLY